MIFMEFKLKILQRITNESIGSVISCE
jgi:hypothetical protein